MLEVSGIDVFYGETQALFDVSLGLQRGEVIAILGPNGAGKTTTLRAILGLTPAKRGHVRFDGIDITRRPTHEIARMGVGWVPDDRRLCPTLTVARNLSIAIKRTKFRPWSFKEVTEIFTALDYLWSARPRRSRVARCKWWRSRARCLVRRGWCCSTSRARGLRPRW
jgi:branched-chain amino acid transport system ATP-binding protein